MQQKVWFITGSNRGLGRAFSEEAVARGFKVIAATRKINISDPFYKNSNVLPVQLDVTNLDQVNQAIKQGIEQFGKIDVLINNAGYGLNGAFEEISDDEMRALFETDYFGVVNVIKAVLPYMRAQRGGNILNVSSQAGMVGMAGCTPYNAAKFALVGISEGLNEELKPWNIHVSVVCPGSFRTDFRDQSSLKTPKNMMTEYDGTAAHNVVTFLKENNHNQQGDPKKAAQFIADLLELDQLPVHILIGKICCDAIKDNLTNSLAEIESYYQASSNTDYDNFSGETF